MPRGGSSTSSSKDQVTAAMPCSSETRHPVPKTTGAPHHCSVLGCPSGNSPVGLWLFSLPCKDTEAALRAAWLEHLHLAPYQSHSPRICFRHFTEEDFVKHRQRIVGLRRTAVPVGTGYRRGGNHLVTCRASSSGSGARFPETTPGVGARWRQGTTSEHDSLRDDVVGFRGNPRVQAPIACGPLKHAYGRLGGVLDEMAHAEALAFDAGAAAGSSSTTPSTGIVAVADAALEADSSAAVSKCVHKTSFGHSEKTHRACAGSVPSAGVSRPTSSAGHPVSAVGATKSSAMQHCRGTQANSLACSGGSYHDLGAQQGSLYDPYSAWTGLDSALDAYTHLPLSSDGSVLPSVKCMLDGYSVVASASSGSHFHEPTDALVEIACSAGPTVQMLNPVVSRAGASCGVASHTGAGEVSQSYKKVQPGTTAGSGCVEGVAKNLPEFACAAVADSCFDTAEPVVAEKGRLFDPSMGKYVIEKETISDEDGHGASAIHYRVTWVFNDSAAKGDTGCKSAQSKAPSGKPSSTRNAPASNFSGRRRKTS